MDSAKLLFVCESGAQGEGLEMKSVVRRVVADGIAWAGGQPELAVAIEPLVGHLYSSQNVSAWKTGRADPYAHVVLAIAKVAGISLDELVLEIPMTTRLDQVEAQQRRTSQTLEEIAEQVRLIREQQDRQRLKLQGE